jgi:hypothetical protein
VYVALHAHVPVLAVQEPWLEQLPPPGHGGGVAQSIPAQPPEQVHVPWLESQEPWFEQFPPPGHGGGVAQSAPIQPPVQLHVPVLAVQEPWLEQLPGQLLMAVQVVPAQV